MVHAAWRDYSRRRRWFFSVSIGGFVLAVCSGELLPPPYGMQVSSCLMFAWFFASVIVILRLVLFKCPRCGEFFFFTWLWHDPFADRCVHCGLPKWSEVEREDETSGEGTDEYS